jgi:vacuolar protein sorting-associated protein 54
LNRDDINPNLIPDLDIRECIHKSIEIIQIRLGKIIAVRKDVTSSLRLDYFLRFFYILSVFLNECESISGLNFKFLPDVLNQQIKNFNGTLQNNNLKKVSRSIETEEWKPLIVSKHLQLIVNNIVGNENLDFGNDWKTGLLHLRQRDQDQSKEEEEENSHKRSIVVGDKTFVANNSLLELISLTKTIFILKSNFNHLSGLYESNIIELYKYYNGRTMQSIKNSDNSLNKEKNLSVVGESLDCIAELIHYIRADFNNPDYDDAYSNLLAIISSSKSKIDSINTIPE